MWWNFFSRLVLVRVCRLLFLCRFRVLFWGCMWVFVLCFRMVMVRFVWCSMWVSSRLLGLVLMMVM